MNYLEASPIWQCVLTASVSHINISQSLKSWLRSEAYFASSLAPSTKPPNIRGTALPRLSELPRNPSKLDTTTTQTPNWGPGKHKDSCSVVQRAFLAVPITRLSSLAAGLPVFQHDIYEQRAGVSQHKPCLFSSLPHTPVSFFQDNTCIGHVVVKPSVTPQSLRK